jgi:hypothetical protein
MISIDDIREFSAIDLYMKKFSSVMLQYYQTELLRFLMRTSSSYTHIVTVELNF